MYKRALPVLALLTVCLIVGVPRSLAATYVVNTTADFPDENPADGVCDTGGGTCSLRAAIDTANAVPGEDSINFDPTIFTPGTVTTISGVNLPQITQSLNISANNPGDVVISGGTTRRAGFNIAPGVTVRLVNLVLRQGQALNGGAIYNAGTLILSQVAISNSNATEYGGGIANIGTLTMYESLLTANSALLGGGIYSEGTMTLINSTLSDNSATDGGGGLLTNNNTTSELRQMTITNNRAGTGGGLDVRGVFSMGNTLVAGNTVTQFAADVYGDVVSLGNNLIGDSDLAFFSGDTTGNLLDAAAQPLNLLPLADNGGFTRTHALGVGSVAINAGRNSLAIYPAFSSAIRFDQRRLTLPNLTEEFSRIIGGTVDIGAYEASMLTLRTTAQGRSTPAPHPSHRIEALVRIIRTGDGMTMVDAPITSDDSGTVTLFGLPAGVYRVSVKGSHTLARAAELTMPQAEATPEIVYPALLEGDASNDNTVTVSDFALLAASFGRATGQVGFDARADFNQDGVVTISDFSLLAANFGRAGETP